MIDSIYWVSISIIPGENTVPRIKALNFSRISEECLTSQEHILYLVLTPFLLIQKKPNPTLLVLDKSVRGIHMGMLEGKRSADI